MCDPRGKMASSPPGRLMWNLMTGAELEKNSIDSGPRIGIKRATLGGHRKRELHRLNDQAGILSACKLLLCHA